ncbi:hypothetical protein LINPERPRIM_LOCUS23478 [Linum perenne]
MGYYAVEVTTLLLIALTTVESADITTCGPATPSTPATWCDGYYGNCVTNVITVLVAITPKIENRVFSSAYPPDGDDAGGAIGTTSCAYSSTHTACRDCLVQAQQWLDYYCTSYATGMYVTDVCTIYFNQIRE